MDAARGGADAVVLPRGRKTKGGGCPGRALEGGGGGVDGVVWMDLAALGCLLSTKTVGRGALKGVEWRRLGEVEDVEGRFGKRFGQTEGERVGGAGWGVAPGD